MGVWRGKASEGCGSRESEGSDISEVNVYREGAVGVKRERRG